VPTRQGLIEMTRAELQAYIETINDPVMREVFRLRYFARLTWHGVSKRMYFIDGCYYTADSVRMMHNRFLKSNGRVPSRFIGRDEWGGGG